MTAVAMPSPPEHPHKHVAWVPSLLKLSADTFTITTRSTSTTAGIEEKQRAGGVTHRIPNALFPCYSTPLPKESQH